MANKGKPAQPETKTQASDPVVEQLQRELKQQGFYAGNLDGVAGKSTRDAVAARDAKRAADDAASLRRLELEQSGKKIDADTAASKVETDRRQRYSDQSSSGEGIAAKSAANSLAPLAGTYLGWKAGAKLNSSMGSSQSSKNNVLSGVADDRVKGLTTLDGARQGAKLSGAMPLTNPLLRSTARMAPHAIIGGLGLAKGTSLLMGDGQPQEYYPEQVDRAFGLGYIGAGGAMIKQGVNNVFNPEVAADAKSIAVINSNGLKRNALMSSGSSSPAAPAPTQPALPAPSAQAPAAPRPDTHAGMRAQAAALKIPGRSTMNKAELASAIGDAIKAQGTTRAKRVPKVTGALGPALAAGLAYAATPDQAQAADGRSVGGQAEGLTNAAAAGGAAYGIRRGIEALPSAIGGAIRGAGEAMAPVMIDAMTDYDDQDLAQGRNMLARNLPSALRGGAVEDAYQMAQVPEPSPMRGQASPDVMQEAQGQGDFETQMAALQEMLAQIGADEDEGPVSNAMTSQRHTQMPQFTPFPAQQQNALLR